jgi:RloB-like protein
MTIVDAAVEFRRRNRRRQRDSFEKNDQIWITCDRDEHPDVNRAFGKARETGIGIAYSNPCVEIWAYLHFSDHDRPVSRHDMQRLLKTVMPSYDKDSHKMFDYDLMRGGYFDADRRAERMEQRRVTEGAAMGNPYTSLFKLMRLIYENGKRP